MAGRLSISFLLSNDEPVPAPSDEDYEVNVFSRPSVFGGSPPVLLASSQLAAKALESRRDREHAPASQMQPPPHRNAYSRPSSSAGSYTNQPRSPFDVRSRSCSDPQFRQTPTPPIARSPPMSEGLEALVQAATQERRRLSSDYEQPSRSPERAYVTHSPERPHLAYSPERPPVAHSPERVHISHSPERAYGAHSPERAYTTSTTYAPEISYSMLSGPGYNPEFMSSQFRAHANPDPPPQEHLDRSSFMKISHISSDYHPPTEAVHASPPPLITDTTTENNEPELQPKAPSPVAPAMHRPEAHAQGRPLQIEIIDVRQHSMSSASSHLHQPPSPTPDVDEPSKQDDDMTLDLEFDLAVRSESGFDMDVDNELLRLVDDNPAADNRPRDSHRRSFSTPTTENFFDEKEESVPPATGLTFVHEFISEASGSKTPKASKAPRKKQTAAKATLKSKQPAKPRTKAAAKPKPPQVDNVSYTASGRLSKPVASALAVPSVNAKASGSRSASVIPPNEEEEAKVDQDGDKENVDDKVYCVCRSNYEEGRVMIACDRCDEWYHMHCLGMSDLEVDLVDQFICPVCTESNPHLSVGTTYKRRCLSGLKDPDPSSPNACHKPAQGAFSKYCSEDCGVNHMQTKIEAWSAAGGNKAKLWDIVKDAGQREGVVIAVGDSAQVKMEVDSETLTINGTLGKVNKQKERELARLRPQLDQIVHVRDAMKEEMEIVLWRETLTQLASDRADGLDECGWDQRLCMDDEDYAEAGAAVLESYGEDTQGEEEEWWCRGKKKCDRHSGWQKLRSAEVAFEKEMKEMGLSKLATSEREIRKRIEDITDPQQPLSAANVTHTNGKGGKSKVNGTSAKSGKKRKAAVAWA